MNPGGEGQTASELHQSGAEKERRNIIRNFNYMLIKSIASSKLEHMLNCMYFSYIVSTFIKSLQLVFNRAVLRNFFKRGSVANFF